MNFWEALEEYLHQCWDYLSGQAACRKKAQAGKMAFDARERFTEAAINLVNQHKITQQALDEMKAQRLTISKDVLPGVVEFCRNYMKVDQVNIKALMPPDVEFPQIEMEKIRTERVDLGKYLRDGAVTGLMSAAGSWALGFSASTGGLAAIVLAPIAAAGIIACNKEADLALTQAEAFAADTAVKIEKMEALRIGFQAVISRTGELRETTGKLVDRMKREVQECERCTAALHEVEKELRGLNYRRKKAVSLEFENFQEILAEKRVMLARLMVKARKLLNNKSIVLRWFCKLAYSIIYKRRIDGLNREIELYQSAFDLKLKEKKLTGKRNHHLVAIVIFIKSIYRMIKIPVLDETGKVSVKSPEEDIFAGQVS